MLVPVSATKSAITAMTVAGDGLNRSRFLMGQSPFGC
jgi:hypothetical protein